MKYPCNVIKDLLPLYCDKICSNETISIIEEHLSVCPECKSHFQMMEEESNTPFNPDNEKTKAKSFRYVKKEVRKKQILITMSCIIILILSVAGFIGAMKHSKQIVKYENNISVAMVDNSIVGRLRGSYYSSYTIKRIEDDEKTYLFFYLEETKWAKMSTSEQIFSEFDICNKSVDSIDKVYYFVGDYNDMENKSKKELDEIINNSILLWEK